MTRQDDITNFVETAGWGAAHIAPLAGDASNRRYFRLTADDGAQSVLMDAPPDKQNDIRPFISIATHLSDLGLSAPQIIHQDEMRGLLLLEDLGDGLFAREIERDAALETPLYEAATDVLHQLHMAVLPTINRFASDVTVPQAAIVFDWYQAGATGSVDDDAKARFEMEFTRLISPFDQSLDVLMLRDYHAENLLWLPQRKGLARVGLLDFQDAMAGHRAYDLVSLLQDARRDVGAEVERAMLDRYIARNSINRDDFLTAYAIFGVQRNLRILGVFARLCMRNSKAHYVDLIPRVWRYLQKNLDHPALRKLETVLSALPEPTDAVLAQIKEKCGTCAGR